ncbi:MAG: YkgJ family cysteine cluster protein [Myxococcales bacterium]|nr:YkgJ family cysteine cluster protein [Myxococcales bacterium]
MVKNTGEAVFLGCAILATVRPVRHRYRDPLDEVWIAAAQGMGIRVERSDGAYATFDGKGGLLIGEGSTLDPDDCLAQMILHEICHSLVQGEDALGEVDWGLDNETDRDREREHACLRLQAMLLDLHGLREVLAPTTEHRAFYDGLGPVPIVPGFDRSSVLARLGWHRRHRAPWGPHLSRALESTATIVREVAPFSAADSLLGRVTTEEPHPLGAPFGAPASRCSSCAWAKDAGRAKVCLQFDERSVDPTWLGCARWEPRVDCGTCGACCREAFTAVDVEASEPFAVQHPGLVTRDGQHLYVLRPGGRCVALRGGIAPGDPFRCDHYDARPRSCRDFEEGSRNCLAARQKVGLSL